MLTIANSLDWQKLNDHITPENIQVWCVKTRAGTSEWGNSARPGGSGWGPCRCDIRIFLDMDIAYQLRPWCHQAAESTDGTTISSYFALRGTCGWNVVHDLCFATWCSSWEGCITVYQACDFLPVMWLQQHDKSIQKPSFFWSMVDTQHDTQPFMVIWGLAYDCFTHISTLVTNDLSESTQTQELKIRPRLV